MKIIPERYGKSYQDWLSEKRGLAHRPANYWWGHRIPVWKVQFKVPTNAGASAEIRETSRQEFLVNLTQFANAFGIQSEIATQRAEGSKLEYYICARTDNAINELDNFYDRHHRARVVGPDDRGAVIPHISHNDPKYAPDSKLWSSIAIMTEQEQGRSRHLVQFRSLAAFDARLAGEDRRKRRCALGLLLSDQRADHQPRTSSLFGWRGWCSRACTTSARFRSTKCSSIRKSSTATARGCRSRRGNGVDPLDVIDKFGADALRFGIAYLTTETQDIRMPVEFECPHCGKLIEQTKDNRIKPKLKCKDVRQGVLDAMGRKARAQNPAPRGGGFRSFRARAELLQ